MLIIYGHEAVVNFLYITNSRPQNGPHVGFKI